MKRISLPLLLFSICFISINNFCKAQNTFSDRHINFDTDWKFHFGDASDPSKDFNYTVATIFSKTGNAHGTAIDDKFNDTSWRKFKSSTRLGSGTPFCKLSEFGRIVSWV